MVYIAKALVIIVFAGGGFIVAQSLPGMAWAEANPSPLQTGLALIAAALTAIVALSITRDWRGQRADQMRDQKEATERALEAEQREQRVSTYARVISSIMQTFTRDEKSDINDLAVDRATLSLWGTPGTLAAVDNWQKVAYDITTNHSGKVPVDRKPEVQRAVASVALAARNDLGLGDVDVDDLAALLFDDFKAE